MEKVIKLRRGLDIRIEGCPDSSLNAPTVTYRKYAVKPTDFYGMQPKLSVQVSDRVMAGSPLFLDKKKPRIKVVSPVSGVVEEVVYGPRRVIEEIRILADEKIEYKDFGPLSLASADAEAIKEKLLDSGLWPFIRQRPYDLPADPDTAPRDIFVSAFDTAPLAPDTDMLIHGQEAYFQLGITALSKLTAGKVHIGVHRAKTASPAFLECKDAEVHVFDGPHPCGNVGIQIHHIRPINKGDVVWYVQPQDVAVMGRLFSKGIYDATKVVALAGSEVVKTGYHKILSGLCLSYLLERNLKREKDIRVISGNVLTGTKIRPDGYIGAFDNMVSVIPEGNRYRFLGWLTLGLNTFSYSRTFWSWLAGKRKYRMDTNTNGETRAFVLTGQYEKVLPMDIYPMQLLKACLAKDIENMEALGIYEVSPEDFALCEYIDASKIEIQKIIRESLEFLRKEVG